MTIYHITGGIQTTNKKPAYWMHFGVQWSRTALWFLDLVPTPKPQRLVFFDNKQLLFGIFYYFISYLLAPVPLHDMQWQAEEQWLISFSDAFSPSKGTSDCSHSSGYGAADPENAFRKSVGHHRVWQPAAAHYRHLHQRRHLCKHAVTEILLRTLMFVDS